jgi:hypothetical protein
MMYYPAQDPTLSLFLEGFSSDVLQDAGGSYNQKPNPTNLEILPKLAKKRMAGLRTVHLNYHRNGIATFPNDSGIDIAACAPWSLSPTNPS